MRTNKALVFDLDGSIVDLYGVGTWLEDILVENPRPYIIAKPLYNMTILNEIVNKLKEKGWKIVVTSWLAKGSSKKYDEKVRKAKINWLKSVNFPYDEIHLVKYGTTKANCTRNFKGFQVLIDDNEKIRNGWHLGDTIDATKNIIPSLQALI